MVGKVVFSSSLAKSVSESQEIKLIEKIKQTSYMNHLIDMVISRDLQTLQSSDYFQCSELGISGTVFWAKSNGDRVKINE